MFYIKITILTLFIFKTCSLKAQNLTSHKWENRILILLTDNTNTIIYKNQISDLERCTKGLEERKLIIYQVKKDSYKIGLQNTDNWIKSDILFKNYKKTDAPFEIILIGLDGGIKLKQNTTLTCKRVFDTIDIMPMRRSEINNN